MRLAYALIIGSPSDDNTKDKKILILPFIESADVKNVHLQIFH